MARQECLVCAETTNEVVLAARACGKSNCGFRHGRYVAHRPSQPSHAPEQLSVVEALFVALIGCVLGALVGAFLGFAAVVNFRQPLAGERGSALVQWLRLPKVERRAGDGLNDDLVTALNKLMVRRNETSLISAVLAARLGLERLWSVDDHSSDTPDSPDPAEQKASTDAIARAWNNPSTRARQAENLQLESGLERPDGIIAMYRALTASHAPMLTSFANSGRSPPPR